MAGMQRIRRRIGIYGGSFDPVHIGHVALVVALKEAHALDIVYIVPAFSNPHKQGRIPVAATHRLKMLKKAFKDLAYCKVLGIEIENKTPSFTIDTIHKLKKKGLVQEKDKLFFLMGEDLIPEFHLWKQPEALVAEALPLVAKRGGGHFVLKASRPIQEAIKKGLTSTPLFDVSASEVRKRLAKGLFCGHLLHPSVLNYINKQSLYNVPNTKT
jgi:nicotinate-nucleotide adenylyltransferase